ncbi:hypothetical protein PPACK8108_LOCUS23100 [Phakopsora pachyrhizi]|uniref:Uncharacterized protein n=1 Tax=Phakopsora pachyrhizi TaxID=170000 RepID=A0AAV0BLQ3_PHAPC|nr:hypothetical protein PPACK8108_LOCUS23100 [Phakopsora pachyrhizi]
MYQFLMSPFGFDFNLKWLQFIIMFFLGLFIHGNHGSLDFSEALSLTSVPYRIDLNYPASQSSNLIDPGLANFDLNELPEDKGPDKSLYHVEGKTELENERDYSWNSKSQMIELAHWTLSPTSSKFSAKIGSVSKEPASSEDRMINESEFVRDVRDSYTNLDLLRQVYLNI